MYFGPIKCNYGCNTTEIETNQLVGTKAQIYMEKTAFISSHEDPVILCAAVSLFHSLQYVM